MTEFDTIVERQRKKLLEVARKKIAHLTFDDILQPQDFPELEYDPEFRFEEGVLHGMEILLAAYRAHR